MGRAGKGLPLRAGRERDHRRIRRHKHPSDLECSWGGELGEGSRLVQHYSQVDSVTVEKTV